MNHRSIITSLFCFLLCTHKIVITASYIQVGMDILSQDAGEEHAAAIDISDDGEFIAVGSPHAGTVDQPDRGEVKIYRSITDKNGDSRWQQIGETIVGKEAGAHVGISVAISDDGKRLVVGKLVDDINQIGAISIFQFLEDKNKWKWIATFDGESVGDKFGFKVGIKSNGKKVFGAALGYVKVFKCGDAACEPNGSPIRIDSTLKVRDVSLASGWQSLAIGAIANIPNTEPGIVKAYTFDGSEWQERVTFVGTVTDRSGFSVAISQSLKDITVVYSAPLAPCQTGDLNCGAIKVFSSKDQGNSFVQKGQVIEGTEGSALGLTVDLSLDRETIVATSLNSRAEPVATVFVWDGQVRNWVTVQTIAADLGSSPASPASIDAGVNSDGRRIIFLSPSGSIESTNVVRVLETSPPPSISTMPSLAPNTYYDTSDCDSGKGKGKGLSCKSAKSKGKGNSISKSSSSSKRHLRKYKI